MILRGMTLVLEDKPLRFDASLLPSIQNAETQVVEDAFHATVVLGLDVVLYGRCVDCAVCNVFVSGPKPFTSCPTQWPVVTIVPVLELHTIDVASVQPLHFRSCLVQRLVVPEGGNETITWEARPVGTDVDGDCSTNLIDIALRVFTRAIHFYHITPKIFRRSLPCPSTRRKQSVGNNITEVTISDAGTRRRHGGYRQRHNITGSIAALVGFYVIA